MNINKTTFAGKESNLNFENVSASGFSFVAFMRFVHAGGTLSDPDGTDYSNKNIDKIIPSLIDTDEAGWQWFNDKMMSELNKAIYICGPKNINKIIKKAKNDVRRYRLYTDKCLDTFLLQNLSTDKEYLKKLFRYTSSYISEKSSLKLSIKLRKNVLNNDKYVYNPSKYGFGENVDLKNLIEFILELNKLIESTNLSASEYELISVPYTIDWSAVKLILSKVNVIYKIENE